MCGICAVQVIHALPVELTKKDLQKMRQKIGKQNVVFSDKRYLDSLYLPSGIIGRKEEAEQILIHVESARQGLAVPLVSVYGRSGSGKSTIVKFVCQNIEDIAASAFVNLRKSRTIFGCANLILTELGAEPLKSAEGLNKVVDKIGEKIQSNLGDKKLFILVLDEYDVIFSDVRGKPSDFVYKLLTLEEGLREKGIMLCIVTISNNALNDYDLDDRVKSRIGNTEVFFTPYSKDNLLAILRDRADKAFSIPVSSDILQYCSELSSSDHGDVRRALDLLRVAGEICNGKEITKPDVNKAQEKLQKDRIGIIVSNVSYHQKTLIGAICINCLYSDAGWTTTSEVYSKYSSILQDGTKPLMYRRISDLLVESANTGLILSRTMSHGRHGYGTEYKLKLSPEMVGPFVGKEWWNDVMKNKADKDRMDKLLKSMNPRSRRHALFKNLF